jgi:hypothetical protein
MRKTQKIFNRIEPILFLVVTLLNLLPVLLVKYFPTVDGPAHLYNARLMAELMSNPSGFLSKYLLISNIIPTNLTDHYFFMLTGYFMPGYLSEKLLILFYLIGLPYAYRYFIRSIRPDGMYLTYFIFPFTYSFMFFYGFFNFHIALVFFMISLTFLKKFYERPVVSNSIIFLILITLIYISHAFVFLILLIYLAFFHYRDIGCILSASPGEIKNTAIARLILIVMIVAPSLVLMIISSTRTQSPGIPDDYMNFSQHLKWIRQIQPAKGIVYQREDIYTTWLFYLLVFLTIMTIYYMLIDDLSFIKGHFRIILKKDKKDMPDHLMLNISLVILALYFLLPDMFKGYGFVSARLLVFFFLFFISWLASGYMNFWIKITAVLVIIVMNTFMLSIYINESRKLNVSACEVEKAASYIPPYSSVLPVNQSGKWIYGHFSNYLGIDKPMVILENYEAGLNYFPINWNLEKIPRMLFGEADSIPSCLTWNSQMNNNPETVSYVLLIKNMEFKDDSCNTKISEILNRFYERIFNSENNEIELYKLVSGNNRN